MDPPPDTPKQSAQGYAQDNPRNEGRRVTSARAIASILRDTIAFDSVLDVGCGLGYLLRELRASGAGRVLGVDGDWVPRENLLIPSECFQVTRLDQKLPSLPGPFDLVVCTEVLEHLHEPAALRLADELASLSDQILFSAAVPYQGGFQHVNEQPQSYWVRFFESRGFQAVDALRPSLWGRDDVYWWYQQNLMLLTRRKPLQSPPSVPVIWDCYHPFMVDRILETRPARDLVKVLWQRLTNRLRALLRFGHQD